jgi:hypothetical protein
LTTVTGRVAPITRSATRRSGPHAARVWRSEAFATFRFACICDNARCRGLRSLLARIHRKDAKPWRASGRSRVRHRSSTRQATLATAPGDGALRARRASLPRVRLGARSSRQTAAPIRAGRIRGVPEMRAPRARLSTRALRQGVLSRDAESSYLELAPDAGGPLDDLFGHSITYRVAVGPRAGQRVFSLQSMPSRGRARGTVSRSARGSRCMRGLACKPISGRSSKDLLAMCAARRYRWSGSISRARTGALPTEDSVPRRNDSPRACDVRVGGPVSRRL